MVNIKELKYGNDSKEELLKTIMEFETGMTEGFVNQGLSKSKYYGHSQL